MCHLQSCLTMLEKLQTFEDGDKMSLGLKILCKRAEIGSANIQGVQRHPEWTKPTVLSMENGERVGLPYTV